ncbi:MAG: anti-sigma factor [Vicinamibacterales bacterium]
MTDAEHDVLREASGLYVLGTLEDDERAGFEAHLTSCETCAAEVRSLRSVSDALPFAATQVDPPASLRARILAAAGAPGASSAASAQTVVPFAPKPKPAVSNATPTEQREPHSGAFWAGWISAAAMLLVAAGAGIYASNLKLQLDDVELRLVDAVMKLQASEMQLANASAAVTAVRTNLALLSAPDVQDLKLSGKAPAVDATGRAFISRTRGLLFAASNLPQLPGDRTYQLWFLTRGAPVSAGIVKPDPQGNITAAFDALPDAPVPTGFAVSVEPEGGVPAPTGAIYLVTQ